MPTGIVKWFDRRKGYGFIVVDGVEAFVHYANIQGVGYRSLTEGQPVQCTLGSTDKGPIALEVQPIEEQA